MSRASTQRLFIQLIHKIKYHKECLASLCNSQPASKWGLAHGPLTTKLCSATSLLAVLPRSLCFSGPRSGPHEAGFRLTSGRYQGQHHDAASYVDPARAGDLRHGPSFHKAPRRATSR